MSKRKCSQKAAHATREHALIAIRKSKFIGVTAFQCKHCKKWHIGRNAKKKLQRLNAIFDQLNGN